MLANNETGVVQPVRELAGLSHAAGALFHSDAVQAAGKLAIDVKALGCDLLSISGHKMYAPQGVGALFVRRNVRLRPIFFGGNHERGRRAGTENVAGIVGLGKAAELARDVACEGRTAIACGVARPPGAGNPGAGGGGGRQRRGRGARGEHEQSLLRPRGGGGAGDRARPEGTGGVGRVGVPVGLDRAVACVDGDGAERGARAGQSAISLSRMTTGDEVDAALALVPTAVARLRKLAPGSR